MTEQANWKPRDRTAMARRVAADIPEGWYVNLGIGQPTQIANLLDDREVIIHAENGVLGVGPVAGPDEYDPWLVNPGKKVVTLVKGGAYVHHADSFAMIRGGHIDLCVLGAFEVSESGDIANWATSDTDDAPAVGGAMDLCAGAKRLWVLMDHMTKNGEPKIVRTCKLPLTAPSAVRRIYTDLAVLDVTPEGLSLVEMVRGLSFDELQARTGAPIKRRS